MSGCECQIDGNPNGETFLFGDFMVRKARKEHRCCECSRIILFREPYEVFDGCYEGRFYQYKTCLDCVSARMLFCSFSFETLWQDFREEMQETSTLPCSCLAKLTPRAREMACAIIEEIWEGEEE